MARPKTPLPHHRCRDCKRKTPHQKIGDDLCCWICGEVNDVETTECQ